MLTGNGTDEDPLRKECQECAPRPNGIVRVDQDGNCTQCGKYFAKFPPTFTELQRMDEASKEWNKRGNVLIANERERCLKIVAERKREAEWNVEPDADYACDEIAAKIREE